MSDTSAVYAAAAELNINLDSNDSNSQSEIETESTEAEGVETGEETNEVAAEGEAQDSEATLDEEETNEAQASNEVKEEPKLTLKEFQEIQAAREKLDADTKAFTERMQLQETEFQKNHHEKLKVHDEMDSFLADIANQRPEVFEIFKEEFQEWKGKMSHPGLDQANERIKSLEAKLEQFTSKASDQVTLNTLDTEMNKFMSAKGKEAEAAGLKIDKKAIEDLWAKGLTVDEAFHAKYGDAYAKALVSKAKVEAVTKKVQARPTVSTAGTVSKTNSNGDSSPKNMSAFESVHYFAKKFGKGA